jgi:hypothetical protein
VEQHAVWGARDVVAGAPVIEARGDVDDESHLPAYGDDPADDAVPVCRFAGTRWGHEVLYLAYAFRALGSA